MTDNNFSLSSPSILLLGGDGQLGLSLFQLIGGEALILPKRAEVDFLHSERLADLVIKLRPAVIINAAAYTLVDQAEVESELAYRINALAVVALAEAAKRVGALLVHFSTDYVFDGGGDRPWREDDRPAPLNVYGLSKWLGEQAILASGCRYLILRTGWLHSPYRHNFLKTMLRLGIGRSPLSVVCDQIGAPTSAAMLAEATLVAIRQTLVNPALSGLYHVTAAGEASWYDYANFIFKEGCALGMVGRIPSLIPVTSDHYTSLASRPLNSRLDTSLFSKIFGVHFQPWQTGVRETLRQLEAEQ